ncbi:unnamed protein product, partial [Rotaria sp. Silwood1]
NDIELKGILSYKTISSIQSPNKTNVSRKSFQSNTTVQLTNKLTINRNKNSCLTPSKPAGTINLIDGYIMIGDITSFYKETFLNIPNLDKNLKENQLIDLPYSNKTFQNIESGHVNVNISSINYSSNKIQTNSTSNVLSSSIQVGANDTVRTTRT